MPSPDPLIISWQGRQLRIRHDDPRIGPYTPRGSVIRFAMELASDVDGLALASTVRDRYRVRVTDDEAMVGLTRRTVQGRPSREGGLVSDRDSGLLLARH